MDLANVLTLIAMLIGLIGVWYRNQFKIERLEEKFLELKDNEGKLIAENKRQINALWEWKDEHEKDAVDMREKYQNQISELKGGSLVVGEQFRQIMAMFEEIKDRLSILENHKNGGNK